MEDLEKLIQEKKSQLRNSENAKAIFGWIGSLIGSMEILPEILRVNLNRLRRLQISDKLDYALPNTGDDEKKNTEIMSLLYSYATGFLQKSLVPSIIHKDKFKPSDLGKGINILSDIKEMVHKMYQSYVAIICSRDDLTKTKANYPIEASTNALAQFFAEYKAVEQMRYICAYKRLLDSKDYELDLVSGKERISREFESDEYFVKTFVMPNADANVRTSRPSIGDNWKTLMVWAKSWEVLAKMHLASFPKNLG